MGGGSKPNSNVPIVDVPKWRWRGRGGVRPNLDNVLKYVFLKASLSNFADAHPYGFVGNLVTLSQMTF